ncbi:hypothetical protein BaRGS_00005462 [Batillaria attramentaria]|uniref:WSC domain-containing protein n=1 Tax=Batillaria attramentaria TaxID=370345 RepID=A0ABD0LV23_9CAEN
MAKHSMLLVLLAGAFLTGAVLCDLEAFIHTGKKKWVKARQSCMTDPQNKCDLVVHEATDAKFWDKLNLPSDSFYWVGAKMHNTLLWEDSRNPLFQAEGCYHAPRELRSTGRPSEYNSPQKCLTECYTGMVALQNRSCFCLDPETLATFSPRPVDECYLFCPRDHHRCGGGRSRLSVYKMPDRTLFEKRGKPSKYYWQVSHNNENQFVLITNRGGKKKTGLFCVSETGQYESHDAVPSGCPVGSKQVTFENMDVGALLETPSATDGRFDDFKLPLTYSKEPMWLDGRIIAGLRDKGYCVAVRRQGNSYTLAKRSCKQELPAICACYRESTDSDRETTSVISSPPSTESTAVDVTSTRTPIPTTTQLITTTAARGRGATTPDYPDVVTTPMEEIRTTQGVSPGTTTEAEHSTAAAEPLDTTSSHAVEVDVPETSPARTLLTEVLVELTVSSATDRTNDMIQFAPPAESAAADSDGGLIAGVTAGCVAVMLIITIVIVIVKRRNRDPAQALVKRDKSGRVSYPI